MIHNAGCIAHSDRDVTVVFNRMSVLRHAAGCSRLEAQPDARNGGISAEMAWYIAFVALI